MSKQLLKLFLFLWVFLLGTTSAWADDTCGDGLTWTISGEGSNKTLTISYSGSGTGAMTGEAKNSYGWNSERSNIKTINVGEGVTSITPRAFMDCANLTTVTLSNTLQTIYWYAFNNCPKLDNITIPASVTEIQPSAFRVCYALKTITIAEGNNSFTSEKPNGETDYSILYDKNKTTLLFYPPKRPVENFILPPTVTTIPDVAFSNAGKNESGNNVTNGLKNILASEYLQSIGARAFEQSSVEKLVLVRETPCTLIKTNDNVLPFVNANSLKIYVPYSKVNTYKTNTVENWSSYSGIIEGFKYQLSNNHATLNLTETVWPKGVYTPDKVSIENLTSLNINANAAVPIYTATSPAQIADFTRVFSTSAATALTATTDYTMSYNSNASSNVGSYTATATGTGDYLGTVTTAYAITSAATATVPTAKTPTYNGNDQELVNAGTVNNGTMKYRLGDTGDYSTAIPTATKAGTYTVYWKVEPATNYAYINTADQKVDVTISKKAPEASEFTFTAPGAAPIVYDGNAKAATVVAKDGISGMGTVTIKYYQGDTEMSPTNPGTYTVKISVAESTGDPANYKATTTELTDDSWTFSIVVAQDVDATEATYYTSLSTALSTAPTGHTVKLLANITEPISILTEGKSITLDLNDKILRVTAQNQRVIILDYGTLTIVDNATSKTTRYWKMNSTYYYWEDPKTECDTDHPEAYKTVGGCITGGNLISATGYGAGIRVSPHATLNLNGGNVVGNHIRTQGRILGAGISNAGVLNIGPNASVLGNSQRGTSETDYENVGGGVYSESTFTNAGTIAYNNSYRDGAGVYINGGTFTNTGSIINNTTRYNGGGIYFNGTTLKISGSAKVTGNKRTDGNTDNNVYLYSGKTINISEGLSTDARIGVVKRSTASGTFTSGNTNADFDPTTNFSSDYAGYVVLHELDDNNQAQIYVYSGTDGNIDWKVERNMPSEGKYTLTVSKKEGASSGVMTNYKYENKNSKDAPWLPFHSFIDKLVVESGVTTIGDACCFKDGKPYTRLATVELSEGITSIGVYAFCQCSSLTTIKLPSTLTTIYNVAFAASGLTSIVIPENVTTICQYAFNNIPSLRTMVLMRSVEPITALANKNPIFNDTDNVTVYVSNSKLTNYQDNNFWSKYKTRIKGWTYRLSGGESGNATLTLSSTSEMYTGSPIEPTALSLKINANAAVPLYNTEATPAQIESITYKFSETETTEVAASNYTLTYTDDHTNVGTKTATATAVAGKNYTFDTSNPVKLDYEITKRPITITVGNVNTAVEWKASYSSSDFSTSLLTVTESTLATGHSYKSANITASETVTAPATKRPLTVSDVVIQDGSGNNVTSNYEVTCVPGSLSEKVTVNLANGWNTFWHPASLVKPASVTPYIVTNVTTGGVAAEEQTYIQGNTAYLLNNTGSAGDVVFDVIYNQPAVTGMDSKFKKSEGITASSSNNYYVLKGSSFVWARSGDIPNYKCYLDLDNNPALSRGVLDIIIGGGDGTTGISEELIVNSEENDSDVWYDMSGRRLDGKPSRKGLYIKNGRKVVIK